MHHHSIPSDVTTETQSSPRPAETSSPSVREKANEGRTLRSGLILPRWARPTRIGLLALADAAVLTLVGLGSSAVWGVAVRNQPFHLYLDLLPLVTLFVLGFAKAGLYPGFGLGAVETIRRLWLWTGFIFLVLAAGSYAFRIPHHYSRMVFILALTGSCLALPSARFWILSLLQRSHWWGEPTVVIGANPVAKKTIETLNNALSLGYCPEWVVSMRPSETPSTMAGLPVVQGLSGAEELARRGARVALVTLDDEGGWKEIVPRLQEWYRHVILIRSSHQIPVEGVVIRNLGGVLGIEFRNQLLQLRNRVIKRSLDLILGTTLFLLSVPVILVGALAIKLTNRGPAFFCHERRGLGGKEISVCKLRTMYVNAEERLEAHLDEHPQARKEWERHYKLADDPRILPGVGHLLRRFSLDELPQLWSVVKGDMSLVGPRPFPDYHLEEFPEDFLKLRNQVRPGLSGLWQVMVRSQGDLEDQRIFDTYYIRNWSLWMDLYVLGRTGFAVLSGRGAH